MSRVSEQWSKAKASSQGRTDANLANDSNNLGGIPAGDYATKKYVQDYHNGKEENLKQYVDSQDASVLEQAKEYTNSQIRNQDFSNFAEISDLQALNNNLTSQIEQGLNAQKQYTDSKTQAIVDDVNANFQDVNGAISTLNGNVNNLFQSVSNGKSLIAGAITDKGVPTSASDSYSTMASKIRSIPSGGGSGTDPNFVNTSDGTATASDILLGKTAYVKGEKIYGTLIAQAEEGLPTYGTDTSNATATAADIVWGKTAYARGQLITGTLTNKDPNVEEIYGVNNDININTNPSILSEDPITNETISRGSYTFSENLDYVVRVERINNVQYIASYPMNENGLYIMQSTGVNGQTETKKYRYSKSELGISENETISELKLAPGTGKTTLLYITTRETVESSTNYNHYLYIFTYHLRENGVIGREYENEKEIVNIKEKIDITYSKVSSLYIFPKHTNPNEFFLGYSSDHGFGVRYGYLRLYEILINADYTTQTVSMKHEYTDLSSNRYSISFGNRELSKNDKFLYHTTYLYYDSYNVIYIDNATNKIYGTSLSTSHICYDYINDKFYTTDTNETEHFLKQYHISFDGNGLKTVEEKTLLIDLSNLEDVPSKISFNETPIIVSNSYMLAFPYLSSGNSLYCLYFNTNINNVSDGETIKAFSKNILSATYDNETTIVRVNMNENRVMVNTLVDIINFGIDYENIIGLKYKNKTFYCLGESNLLTATASNVIAGKTFIGQNGTVETGTMEVSE